MLCPHYAVFSWGVSGNWWAKLGTVSLGKLVKFQRLSDSPACAKWLLKLARWNAQAGPGYPGDGARWARWKNAPTEVVIFKRILKRSVRWTDVTMKCHSVTENVLSPKRTRHGHVGIVDAQAQWKWSARYPSGRTASGWFHVLLFGFLPKFGALTWLIDTSCPNIGNCPSRTRSPQRHPFGRGWLWLGCTRVLRCAEYSMPLYLKTWVTIEEMRSDHSIWIPVWKSIYNIHLNVFAVYSLWLVQLSNRAAIYKYTYTTVDAFT